MDTTNSQREVKRTAVLNNSHGIKSWPATERPREILLGRGAESLSDAQLLAVLLRGGTKGRDAIALSRSLIEKFGSLRQLLMAKPAELCAVSGIGPAKAAQILAACEMSNRRLKENAVGSNIESSPQAVLDHLSVSLRDRKEEVFQGVFLNKKNEVIESSQLAIGLPDKVTIYPRKIVEKCLTLAALKIILVHNHPSGSLDPSNRDIQLTVKIRDGLKFIDVEVLDHIIVGKGGIYSMRNSGDLAAI